MIKKQSETMGKLPHSGKTAKKPFIKPEVKVYKKLEDITLFTSTQNVSGGTFF